MVKSVISEFTTATRIAGRPDERLMVEQWRRGFQLRKFITALDLIIGDKYYVHLEFEVSLDKLRDEQIREIGECNMYHCHIASITLQRRFRD
jgi:hypothetical protein